MRRETATLALLYFRAPPKKEKKKERLIAGYLHDGRLHTYGEGLGDLGTINLTSWRTNQNNWGSLGEVRSSFCPFVGDILVLT